MRKLTYISLIIASVFMISGCANLKKMIKNADDINYKMDPEVLELHDGKVELKIVGQFPEKYFSKKVEAEIMPYIVWEGGEKALTPVYVQGEKVKDNNQVINYKPGGKFTYTDRVDYVDAMKMSRVEIRIKGKQGNKEAEFDPEVIGYGVIATPSLVNPIAKTSFGSDKFVKDIADKKVAVINYDKNQYNLKNTEAKKDEIKDLKTYIEEANENDRIDFTGMNLKSYASPEGTVDRNTAVSGGRSKTAENFVAKEFRKIEDFKADGFVKPEITVEDWEGFKQAVEESSLPEKDMVLRVVQMHSDPDVREQEIRNMTKTFETLEQEIHPKLRRSELIVNVMLIGNTDEEIKELYANDFDKLTQEEILYLGTLCENNEKKLEVYTKYTDKYTDDWRGFNNLGVVQYELNNIPAAKTALEKAKSIDANATVFNNLGNVALIEGDVDQAKEYYQSATGVNEASYGQGIISVQKGQYKEAGDYFGADCSFNNALALLLAKDYDGAIEKASCGEDKDAPMNYYLKAIANARKDNRDETLNNLRTAVAKDQALKGRAKTDMEFHKYFEDATFKEIVN